MNQRIAATVSMLVMASAAYAQPRVIITEIMYNPDSEESQGQAEWVEIANVGSQAIDIRRWRLDDEDSDDWGTFSCRLGPGGIAVLVNADAVTVDEFKKAWMPAESNSSEKAVPQLRYQIIPVKWAALANHPDETNESLKLLNGHDEIVCEVNYGTGGDWPNCNNPDGPSIWLSDFEAPILSDPILWRKSEAGKFGAMNNTPTEVFNGVDVGSPGFVPGVTPDPQPVNPNDPVPTTAPGTPPGSPAGSSTPPTAPPRKGRRALDDDE